MPSKCPFLMAFHILPSDGKYESIKPMKTSLNESSRHASQNHCCMDGIKSKIIHRSANKK